MTETNDSGSNGISIAALAAIGADRANRVRSLIRAVPGFPHEPIVFQDITPLLADGAAFRDVIEAFALLCEQPGGPKVDVVAGIEARGFVLGAPLAIRLGVGFVPLRKAGKLPPPVTHVEYQLEYGSAAMEITDGTIKPGASVLVIDDVLATGGTALAAASLVEKAGASVAALMFLLDLSDLGGMARLGKYRAEALLRFP